MFFVTVENLVRTHISGRELELLLLDPTPEIPCDGVAVTYHQPQRQYGQFTPDPVWLWDYDGCRALCYPSISEGKHSLSFQPARQIPDASFAFLQKHGDLMKRLGFRVPALGYGCQLWPQIHLALYHPDPIIEVGGVQVKVADGQMLVKSISYGPLRLSYAHPAVTTKCEVLRSKNSSAAANYCAFDIVPGSHTFTVWRCTELGTEVQEFLATPEGKKLHHYGVVAPSVVEDGMVIEQKLCSFTVSFPEPE